MKIIYIGSLPDGTLADPTTGNRYEFKKGEAIEVSDAFAKLALVNPDWKTSKEKESK